MTEPTAPTVPLKVAFAGTPVFAQTVLAAIHKADFALPLVLTQPDRPAGRGMRLRASAVKTWAQAQQIPVLQPRRLSGTSQTDTEALAIKETLHALFAPNAQGEVGADVLVVVAYGMLLPQWLLDLPRLGCINVHASLLPRWRGAAPVQRAIEAGDSETGISIMQMDAGLDTGPILRSTSCAIAPNATSASLLDKLACLGADLCVQALADIACSNQRLLPRIQPDSGVYYAHKIDKAQAHLDWRLPAIALERKIRAFNPYPVARSTLDGEVWRIWQAQALPLHTDARPGAILGLQPQGLQVAAGQGSVLCLCELQRAGGNRLTAKDFLAGKALPAGAHFVL